MSIYNVIYFANTTIPLQQITVQQTTQHYTHTTSQIQIPGNFTTYSKILCDSNYMKVIRAKYVHLLCINT